MSRAGLGVLRPLEVTFKAENGIAKQKFEFIKKNIETEPFVSYKIDKENSVGIFTLNSCKNNEEYRFNVDNFFSDIAKNNIKNVVIDLRKNTGGNSSVITYFYRYISNLKTIVIEKLEMREDEGIKVYERKTIPLDKIGIIKSDQKLFDDNFLY